jgi:hypothetical protein
VTDLLVNHDGIIASAARLSAFRQTVRFDPFPPSIASCGSANVAETFRSTHAHLADQDDTMRESWASVGDQLRATVDAYTATDQSIANQGS